MAELATISRPYSEAVFQIATENKQEQQWSALLETLAAVIQAPEIRQLELDPKVTSQQVVGLIMSILGDDQAVSTAVVQRFLLQLVAHGRLMAISEIKVQYEAMLNASKGVHEVMIHSAFALDEKQLADLMPVLEKRFGTKLRPQMQIDESLIGGICAVVGDDMLDLSVKARLEQMKLALMAA